MKKLITGIAIIIGIFSVSSLYAQQNSSRMEEMRQKMKSDLKMTDAQADSVSAIMHEFGPKRRDVYADQTLNDADKKSKMEMINDQANKRLQAALGDDMFKKYQDWWAKNRPMRGGGKSQ